MCGFLAIQPDASAYENRGPIEIIGNGEFSSANGVTGGTGSSVDPYIIEGWSISVDAQAESKEPISIEGTDAHVIIRNVQLNCINGWAAIGLLDVMNVELENADIQSGGIHMYRCHSVGITGSSAGTNGITGYECSYITIENCELRGTWGSANFDDASHIAVRDCVIEGRGVVFENVSYSSIEGNDFYGRNSSIWTTEADTLTISGNSLSDRGIFITANSADKYRSCVIGSDNWVGSQRISVYRGQAVVSISGDDLYQAIMIDCGTVTVSNANLSNSPIGLVCIGAGSLTIDNSTFSNCDYGLMVCDSTDVTMINNIISSNRYGGAALVECSNGLVRGNLFAVNKLGMWFAWDPPERDVSIPGGGLSLVLCNQFMVYGNDFYENDAQAYSMNCTSVQWDGGYDLKGNYWSGYGGMDQRAGPDQLIPSPDGVWDRAVELYSDRSKDRYPVVEPFRELPEKAPVLVPHQENDNEPLLLSALCLTVVIVALIASVLAGTLGAKKRGRNNQ